MRTPKRSLPVAMAAVLLLITASSGVTASPSTAGASTASGAPSASRSSAANTPLPRQGVASVDAASAGGADRPAAKTATVATTDSDYQTCGRVFPDPHAFWPLPTQTAGRSPWAKGNAACASQAFLDYSQMVSGLSYLQKLFPKFVDFYELERDFGKDHDCATSTNPKDMCSAGLPNSGGGRTRQNLYMVRVTDERVPDTNKKFFVFPLSVHGIERAGAEAGVRATEDLATWAFCEAVKKGTLPAKAIVNCAQEGAMPHPLMEAQPDGSVTAGKALRRSAIYFVFANPDGWHRGDSDNVVRYFQRYNGNGVDLNRDWPTKGYTFKPYTPWSEPEDRAFGKVLKAIRPEWTGGIDLHGQLIDRAFSFTLMGATQRDYAKNQRILQTVKGAWADAEKRLSWSAQIKPNTAPDQCSNNEDPTNCDERMWGVQWGTVWDTIAYTVTGDFGDWIDSPMGLNGDGIDNEMSVSHLINCGVGSCYLHEFEQLHVDGNKSLVYSMVNYSLKSENTRFKAPGKVAWISDPTVRQHDAEPTAIKDAWKALPHQKAIKGITLGPDNDWTYTFQVKGPEQGIYNGGLQGLTTLTNAAGIGAGDDVQTVLEKFDPKAEGAGEVQGCGTGGKWVEINRYFSQGVGYNPAGQAVHANAVLPGKYRICLVGSATGGEAGVANLDITFSREPAWADPGQLAYNVSNMQFFRDLTPHMQPGQLVKVMPLDVLSGKVKLAGFDTVILDDDAWPFLKAGNKAWRVPAFAAKLRTFVEHGGNLVLTDGAMQALGPMGVVDAGAVKRHREYAGFVAFTADGGSTDTYADPLAKNINQPGAAEGPGHRHQTYEPVPIGFAIQDEAGNDLDTSPTWTVDQAAWETAGGRTAGTTGDGLTSLGEIKVGSGVVRIIGSLLPMPTEKYYHPFGLFNYSVTYTGYQLLKNALQRERPS